MNTTIIVPARLASTRFPQKLLHEVKGKPVLLWTADRIRSEAPEFPLVFAVDNEKLAEPLRDAGYDVMMTNASHTCGTDRIAEANRAIRADVVINVQADEPLVRGEQIRQLSGLMQGAVEMATLGTPLRYDKDYHNPNHVKLVCDTHQNAIYFSRAAIPFFRDSQGIFEADPAADYPIFIHLGLYAYTASFLEKFSRLPKGRLEQIEKLEMLRALEHGHRIAVGITHDALIEMDTAQNLVEFENVVKERFPSA